MIEQTTFSIENSPKRATRTYLAPKGFLTVTETMKITDLTRGQLIPLFHKKIIKGYQRDKGTPIYFDEQAVKDFVARRINKSSSNSDLTKSTKDKTLQKAVDINTLILAYPNVKNILFELKDKTLIECVVELIRRGRQWTR